MILKGGSKLRLMRKAQDVVTPSLKAGFCMKRSWKSIHLDAAANGALFINEACNKTNFGMNRSWKKLGV